ncbi:MAG: FkbM family methyltransferase [Acidobacteriota bacterium]
MLTRIQSVFEKLRRIWTSDLILRHKFLYLIEELAIRLGPGFSGGVRTFILSDGCVVHLRNDSTDRKVFDEVFLERIYDGFAEQLSASRSPAVLVDLGANIGLSAIALARKLNLSHVVAVEPDRENYRVLSSNLDQFGQGADNRRPTCRAIQAFAGAERGFAQVVDSGNGAWGLRMGTTAVSAHHSNSVQVLPLNDLVPPSAPGTKTIVKCDIEGAESGLFRRILHWDHAVDFMILELHTEFFTAHQLRASLEQSHYHWQIHGELSDDALLAVVGLERRCTRATTVVNDLKSLAQSHS